MRFLKIAGGMGPKTLKSFAELAAQVGTQLGENDTSQVNEDSIRVACADGALTVFKDSNPQCLTGLSGFCHRVGLRTWTGDTAKTPPDTVGGGQKLEFLAEDPADIVAHAIDHQPKRKSRATVATLDFLSPEALAELSPVQRRAIIQRISDANALDDKALKDFENKVVNAAKGLRPTSRQKVLDFMDQLAQKDKLVQ